MKKISLALLLLVQSSLGAKPTEAVKKFLGADAMMVLESATRVEAFRLDPEDRAEGGAPNERMGGYKVTAQAKGAVAVKDLAAVLFDEKTYDFRSAKRCQFSPGIGYRLWKDRSWTEVLLCFSCNELRVITPGREATEDFNRSRAKLVKLAQRTFPGDAQIQGLSPSVK